jgi:hypothetical protein
MYTKNVFSTNFDNNESSYDQQSYAVHSGAAELLYGFPYFCPESATRFLILDCFTVWTSQLLDGGCCSFTM